MDAVVTNPYRVAGERAAIELLRGVEASLEKGADLDMFQLETLAAIIRNDVAPLVLFASDPRLPFVYVAMRKIVDQLLDRQRRAVQQHEQRGYSYGVPFSDVEREEVEDDGAFDFKY